MKAASTLLNTVVHTGLCSGCGTCAGVCMKNCITFDADSHLPHIDASVCVDCGACTACCPSMGVEFLPLKETAPRWDDRVGPYDSFIYSSSTDTTLRKNGASGGSVSAVLKYALEKGLVDKVYCAQKSGEAFTVFAADNVEDLAKTQGSKYIPIPMGSAVSAILKEKKRVAVVGTPCQLQGVTKAAKRFPKLNEYVVYKIGLFCGFVQPKDCLPALRNYLGAVGDEWQFDGWRCGEYPGYVQFTHCDSGEKKQLLIYEAYNIVIPFYSLEKCFMCPDGLNRCADVVFGDVHSRGFDENCGIVRTNAGAQLIDDMCKDGYLNVQPLSLNEAMKSTVGSVSYLKGLRAFLYRDLVKHKPPCDITLDKSAYKPLVLLQNKLQMRLYRLARKPAVIRFAERHPKLQMRWGRYLYTFPNQSLLYRLVRRLVNVIKRKR